MAGSDISRGCDMEKALGDQTQRALGVAVQHSMIVINSSLPAIRGLRIVADVRCLGAMG
jgi:hypothetical protein